jgi:hypothetical protein
MEIPYAPLKELRSTGYFYDKLKAYSESPDMALSTYCVNFVSPYLAEVSASYDKTGLFHKSKILKLAIKYLSNPKDDELIDLIFGIRKIAASEVDKATRADFTDHLDKAEAWANRQKLQSAEFLLKLLLNIIKIFRLPDSNTNLGKTDENVNPTFEAISESWEILEKKIS